MQAQKQWRQLSEGWVKRDIAKLPCNMISTINKFDKKKKNQAFKNF